jgi:hypothetical protein
MVVGLIAIVSFAGAVSADNVAEIHPALAPSTDAESPVTAVAVPAEISN